MYTASRCGLWPRALMENADRIPIIPARWTRDDEAECSILVS